MQHGHSSAICLCAVLCICKADVVPEQQQVPSKLDKAIRWAKIATLLLLSSFLVLAACGVVGHTAYRVSAKLQFQFAYISIYSIVQHTPVAADCRLQHHAVVGVTLVFGCLYTCSDTAFHAT
jgi:hypothetical protein